MLQTPSQTVLRAVQMNNHGRRFGQAVYNYADNLFPDVTRRFQGTSLDPFHNDAVVTEFLDALDIMLSYENV